MSVNEYEEDMPMTESEEVRDVLSLSLEFTMYLSSYRAHRTQCQQHQKYDAAICWPVSRHNTLYELTLALTCRSQASKAVMTGLAVLIAGVAAYFGAGAFRQLPAKPEAMPAANGQRLQPAQVCLF